MSLLYQVTSNYFCVGLIKENGIIIEAAPIIKYSIGKRFSWFREYCDKKGWNVQIIDEFCLNV